MTSLPNVHFALEPLEARVLLALPAADLNAAFGYRQWTGPAPNQLIDNKLVVGFRDTNASVLSYRIERSQDGVTWPEANWETVSPPFPNAPYVFRDYRETAGGKWFVRVSTLDGTNPPVYSSIATYANPVDGVARLTAQASAAGISITLAQHPSAPVGVTYTQWTIDRKPRGAVPWSEATLLTQGQPPVDRTYLDTTATPGTEYEYRVSTFTSNVRAPVGYIYAGNKAPVSRMENRGKVLLVVDDHLDDSASKLNGKLARFIEDLTGDGYTVLPPLYTPRDNGSTLNRAQTVPLRNQILQVHTAAGGLSAITLIGHVPVPYSGTTAWDFHGESAPPDHRGAWVNDSFYGNFEAGAPADYTDTVEQFSGFEENKNVPGDFKLDQNVNPGVVEVPVGRIDLSRLDGISGTAPETVGLTGEPLERALLRQYFDKDHAWRMGALTVETRAVIDDHWGFSYGAEPAWNDFSTLVGPGNTHSMDYVPATRASSEHSYLWGFGAGPGATDNCHGVISLDLYRSSETYFKTVFSAFTGSYFGDWDKPDNLLRATLGDNGLGLTTVWGFAPHWNFHGMGLGEPIANTVLQAYNNDGSLYQIAGHLGGFRGPHTSLLGDPTLRMHVVAPPERVYVFDGQEGGIEWDPSPDEGVIGYHVYKADSMDDAFARIATSAVEGEQFYDPNFGGNAVYMVRAMKLEETPSGTYYNLSQGAFGEWGYGEFMMSQGGSSSFGAASGTSTTSAPSAFIRIFDALGDLWNGTASELNGAGTTSTSGSQPVPVAGWTSSHSLKVDVRITETGWQKLSLGFKSGAAGQVVQVVDPVNGRVYAAQTVGTNSTGQTLHFKVRGNVKVVISNPTGGTVKLAGMRVARIA